MPTAGAPYHHYLIQSCSLCSYGRFVYVQATPLWPPSFPFAVAIVTGDLLHSAITLFTAITIVSPCLAKIPLSLSLSLSLPLPPGSCLMNRPAVSTTTMSAVIPCQLGKLTCLVMLLKRVNLAMTNNAELELNTIHESFITNLI